MDFTAIALFLVILIFFILFILLRRSGKRARNLDQTAGMRRNDGGPTHMPLDPLVISNAKGADMTVPHPDAAVLFSENLAPSMKPAKDTRVNVGQLFGYGEDVIWDVGEYRDFKLECERNGYQPADIFLARMKLSDDAAQITLMINEMISLENQYSKVKSENATRLELIRDVVSAMYD